MWLIPRTSENAVLISKWSDQHRPNNKSTLLQFGPPLLGRPVLLRIFGLMKMKSDQKIKWRIISCSTVTLLQCQQKLTTSVLFFGFTAPRLRSPFDSPFFFLLFFLDIFSEASPLRNDFVIQKKPVKMQYKYFSRYNCSPDHHGRLTGLLMRCL